jgi:hypothetical protein
LPLATAACCPEINLILRMNLSLSRLLSGLVHHANPQSPSASPKIEKSACDQSNPARNPIHHTHPIELAVIPA